MADEIDHSRAVRGDTEASALFNPAFGAVVLNRACAGFESKAGHLMPLTYAYLVLPSALHMPTRTALPGTVGRSMHRWLRENPLVLSDLAVRVRSFRGVTSEAIIFGIRHAVLGTRDGALEAGHLRRRSRALQPTGDWESCMRAADFLGKWLGGSGNDEPTTLAQWGLRP
ncbi:hypothetical protein KVF89_25520 [Nocardioides carbamazepini]|uniref:three component ABC system middle component n=1 Tax=Nocardioides carbamazepini TaxID=2854259 RepID=UPI00214A4895|nr:three component ABC system middle component [Nocardioides carbamazepini]MCR1785920.1 hypothetical protein [Nocardioides carbamazepini]